MFQIDSVTSADGTPIGYRSTGTGPGLIIAHGAGRISQNYEKLARALADTFTVHIPDRRGRGLSGPEGAGYGIQKAAEDLRAVIKATSAEFVFGHSAGGLIALETMLTQPVKKLALYEPAVSVNRSFPLEWLPDFERALEQGKRKKAMAVSLKGLNAFEGAEKIPLFFLQVLITALALAERKKEKGTRMLDLLHTLPADVKMVLERDSKFKMYERVTIPVALLAGANSAQYFRDGVKTLAGLLPHSAEKIFEGFDHYSPEEKTEEIAAYLKRFFSGSETVTGNR